MLDSLKEKAIAKGMALLNSPVVTKAMESETVGTVLEKAMTLPIKISEGIHSNKEKLTSFMELASKADLDEIKQMLSRMEDELNSLKNKKEKQNKKEKTK
jgi:tRNA(Phe) wybutosine-synthesizing methylase Tyw3